MAGDSRILVVDDDAALGRVLAALLAQEGLEADHVTSGVEALARLDVRPYDLVLTDLRMPRMDGMTLLAKVARACPGLPVIMLTAHGNVPLAVEAMKAGAAEFLLKPFDRQELLFVVKKALAVAESVNAAPPSRPHSSSILGESVEMREVFDLIRRVSPSASTVLLLGESGTGKELVARAVHEASPRRAKPFVKIHCGALPDNLLESELFGYEKGAFTGAAARKPGRIELADGGTLLLDEIGDITHAMQLKLLRVLQEREFERLGGTTTLKVDVRFIAATHRDLSAMVQKGDFREDLFYRLNVVPIHLPPLRARPGDVESLVSRFVSDHATANGKDLIVAPEALALLARQPWPGNVRQLQHFIERLVVLSEGSALTARDVERELARAAPSPSAAAGEPKDLDGARKAAEREAIKDALARAGGNRTVAARILGLSRRGLYYKLDEHGLA